eukprot:GDKJ01019415.1.p1 GENE.GDKJ01019415.1~~GDKJ01019415.1.p1  ORF type:complete len:411 (+),score=112.32 GDKJ01019415.1:104-1234(+)
MRNGEEKVVGATCLEWVQEAGPTKYLVGSETGLVFALNRKPKGNTDVTSRFGQDSGHHHGPVYSVKRNPFISKYFLTVGDWSARIFAEDSKAPIITSTYHDAMLQTGCWSPTRPGVFMVGRRDGVVDFWDYYYRQNEVACSHKVSDAGIWSTAVRGDGRLMACGDTEGKVTILDLCPYLYTPYGSANAEKAAVTAILDREASREKGLEAARRATGGKAKTKKEDKFAGNLPGLNDESSQVVESEFFKLIGRAPPATLKRQDHIRETFEPEQNNGFSTNTLVKEKANELVEETPFKEEFKSDSADAKKKSIFQPVIDKANEIVDDEENKVDSAFANVDQKNTKAIDADGEDAKQQPAVEENGVADGGKKTPNDESQN